MNTELKKVQDRNRLVQSLELAKNVITKDYLYQLSEYQVLELPSDLRRLNIDEYTRIYKFTRIVSDQNESVIDKFVTVLNAAYSSNATVITLISGHKEYIEYYLGVVSKDVSQQKETIETQSATLKGVLTGNFPGMEVVPVSGEEKKRLLNNAFVYDYVTSISGIASIRNEKDHSYEKFVQGIEHLVDSLQGREYSVAVIADPVKVQDIASVKLGYESLYTQLSPFLRTSISFNESETITLTQSHTDGVAETVGESVSLTQNYSTTSGWSESSGHGSSSNKETGRLAGSLVGAGVGTAAFIVTGCEAGKLISEAAKIGSGVGGMLLGSSGENANESRTTNKSTSNSSGTAKAESRSKAIQNSDTSSEAEGTTHGKTLQFTNENKTVKNLLDTIDKQLERLEKCESYGAFNCATYVFSSDPETNAIVSSGYNALMRGDNSAFQASQINNWNVYSKNGTRMKEYLMKLSHPLFRSPLKEKVLLSPASIMNSYELAVNMGLPKKSIRGVPVFDVASFGRETQRFSISGIVEQKAEPLEKKEILDIGNIVHMYRAEKQRVKLDVDSLTSHVFVTGSTGTGKSNTIYQILSGLLNQNKKVMVIEPAKGEYSSALGDKCQTYGTNPRLSKLLRINPFAFPTGNSVKKPIHVLEHIDRLIEILNACWPMYAAMPAVLKDAVEQAYINKGWDLYTSECHPLKFPTFADVLKTLPEVMKNSMYSQDTQSDYAGALVTRVKSLTNGINGLVLCASDEEELSNKELFEQNVIIDISRVGSSETKALLMGVLIMKLQEYHMSFSGINESLRHVTVIEEAHNLLRRTSMGQGQESANLQGKSVEMLTNSIAEMRTYGEGFIIADQAPGLLDEAVIRNTNTKIILRLPEAEDRLLVGKAAALNEDQIEELAKLPRGVAAVYQNDWVEAVLCQFEKFHMNYKQKDNDIYELPKRNMPTDNYFRKLFGIRDRVELKKEEVNRITKWIEGLPYPENHKNRLLKVLRGENLTEREKNGLAFTLFEGKKMYEILQKSVNPKEGIKAVDNNIKGKYSITDDTIVTIIRQNILQYLSEKASKDFLEQHYLEFMKRRVL